MKYILTITKQDKNIEMIYNSKKKPSIIYNNKEYIAYTQGEVIESEIIKNHPPIPKGIVGFVIDDYILFITSGIHPSARILNPGYQVFIKSTKKNKIISTIITSIVIILIIVLIIILM